MKPTWEKKGIQLYLGDSREILPILQDADAMITDPPYGINRSSGTVAKKRAKGNYNDLSSDTKDYVEEVCIPIVRIGLDKVSRSAITPGNRMFTMYPTPAEVGCFWQPAACGVGPWGFCNMQPIFYYGRDPRIGKGQKPSGRTVTEKPGKFDHPCVKPTGAWTWLVDKVCLPGETVIDPFMGSGTTGVSCIHLGLKFIGIEKEPKYFEIAVKRLEIEMANMSENLFSEAPL